MTASHSRAVYKLALSSGLSQARPESVTLQAAADQIGCSAPKIRHFESGRNTPRPDEIEQLMAFYGASQDQTRELVKLAQQVRDTPAEQDLSRLANTPNGFKTFLGLEQGARQLTEWAVLTVPGLLQTREYATAVMAGHESGLSDRELRRRVDLRMRRQAVLQRGEDAPSITAILDESVLSRQVGGVDVLRAQLDHLVQASLLPNVSLRVLTHDRVVPASLHGPFIAMDFGISNHPGVVYLEDRTGGRAIDDADEIDDYLMIVDELLGAALSAEESRKFVKEKGAELP